MGWVWRDEDDDDDVVSSNSDSFNDSSSPIMNPNPNPNPSSGNHCSTRKIVQSKCNTVEVEPGKFVRKCQKTEQILRDCVGKPTEIVESNTEYTEDDVTNEMKNGSSSFLRSPGTGSSPSPFDMPGLRNDLEAIERSVFGGLNRFFEAANDMSNGFFRILDDPSLFGADSSSSSSSSSNKRGIPVEDDPVQVESGRKSSTPESGRVDLSGLARDV